MKARETISQWGRTLAGDLFFSAAIFGIYYELLVRSSRNFARPTLPGA